MRRRDLIKGVAGSAIAWPLAAHAQQAQSARRIGVLMNLSESDPEMQSRMAAIRDGLRKLGWIEGRNLQVVTRWAAGEPQRMRAYAAELVAMKPEVIVASAASAATALQRETRTVPIVFAQIIDPVGLGLVASISQPGGNITGFSVFEFAIAAHWVELLKQFAPNLTRVAAIYDNASGPAAVGLLPMTNAGARMNGIEVTTYAVRNDAEIVQAIETFAREPDGGLIPLPSELIGIKRELIISLAAKHRLPNIYAFRYYPENGGLASYGVDNVDNYRSAADYVDRILKGAKPGELPVQFPTKYQLVINLKTAKALGLTVPDKLLVSADEVIE